MGGISERLAIASQKGGTAKTATAVGLAGALAARGVPSLVVDIDPQANATSHLGLEPTTGLAECLAEDARLGPAVAPTTFPGIDLVPSSGPWLDQAERKRRGEMGAETILRRELDRLLGDQADRWRFVLIDCPPHLGGLLTGSALVAADAVLVPTEATGSGLAGVAGLLRYLEPPRRLNPGLRLRGILAARVGRTRLALEVVAKLRERFGAAVFEATIPERIAVAEAWGFGQPLEVYAPQSDAATAYRALADELLASDSSAIGAIAGSTAIGAIDRERSAEA